MMDYLTSLVARNLELLEVIQPRLTSRFEPSGPTSGTFYGSSAWRDTTAEAEPVSEAATTAHISKTSKALPSDGSLEPPRPFRRFQDHSASSQPPLDLIADKASNRRPGQTQGQQSTQDAAPQLVDARDENAVQPRQNLSQAQFEQPPGEPLHPKDPQLGGSKTIPDRSPEQAGVMPAASKNTTRTTSPGSGKQKHRTASEQTIQPALAQHASPAEGGSGPESPFLPARQITQPREVVPQVQVTPSVQSASAPLVGPARVPQAAPVIRVSIGRVEVHAVMAQQAPPPPRPQARSGPSLSLEDYLKEREGGKR
jgi:hypothetical protein